MVSRPLLNQIRSIAVSPDFQINLYKLEDNTFHGQYSKYTYEYSQLKPGEDIMQQKYQKILDYFSNQTIKPCKHTIDFHRVYKEKLLDIEIAVGNIIFIISEQIIRLDMERV